MASGFDQTDVIYDNKCYSFIRVNQNAQGLSWYGAEALCMQLGGHLASITSQTTADQLKNAIMSYSADINSKFITGFWIGLYKEQWAWIYDGQ